jgi:hypothetical protein
MIPLRLAKLLSAQSASVQNAGLGTFSCIFDQVPGGKMWLVQKVAVKGFDPTLTAVVGQTDFTLSGIYVVPQGATLPFIPDGFNQLVAGGIAMPGIIRLETNFSQVELGAVGLPPAFQCETISEQPFWIPETWRLAAVWASAVTPGPVAYPTATATLEVSALIAQVDKSDICLES